MEKIVERILKQYGIEQIGILDKEKDIWIYIKEEEAHLCRSNLASIDRDAVGFGQDLIIFTIINDTFQVVRDNDTFTNFIVIDSDNKILLHKKESHSFSDAQSYVIQKADNKNFLIIDKEKWDECRQKKPSGCCVRYDWMYKEWDNSFVFIDNEYLPNYNLCFYIDNTFLVDNSHDEYSQFVITLKKGKGVVYKGQLDYLWIHSNGSAEIVSFKRSHYSVTSKNDDGEETEEYQTTIVNIIELGTGFENGFRVADYINFADIQHNNTELAANYDKWLFSNNYLVVPFNYCYGAFVICNNNGMLSPHTIKFNKTFEITMYSSFSIQLINEIIKITETFDGCSDFNSYYYSLYGYYLGKTWVKGINYLIYKEANNNTLLNSTLLKGIIRIDENKYDDSANVKVIAPPIFEKIEIIDNDNGLFKVWMRDYVTNDRNVRLFSEKSGLIEYDGHISTPHYSNFYGDYEEPCDNYNEYYSPIASCAKCNMFQIYCQSEYASQYGLLLLGEKVLNANYDEIKGFDFVDDFGEESENKIISQTKQYKPLCVIVCKSDLFGILYKIGKESEKDYNFIIPSFDYLRCEKIFKGHAYFRVQKDGKYGIISDSITFNQSYEVEYDDAYFKTVVGDNCYFTVEKKGKVGAISTQTNNNIPLIFDEIDDIVKSGVICNDILYNKSGEILFSLEDKYNYIKTKYCDVFESNESGDFVFINSQGVILSYHKVNNNKRILHIDNLEYIFDIKKKDFIEEEYDYGDFGCEDDDYDYERDTWNAMTDGQYGDMPEGFDGDYDFTGN